MDHATFYRLFPATPATGFTSTPSHFTSETVAGDSAIATLPAPARTAAPVAVIARQLQRLSFFHLVAAVATAGPTLMIVLAYASRSESISRTRMIVAGDSVIVAALLAAVALRVVFEAVRHRVAGPGFSSTPRPRTADLPSGA